MNTQYTPQVSVVMPVHNGEKYLAEAIESVLNQTFTDFEFFIINDGSTDETAEIIQKYVQIDSRIIPLQNDKKLGQSKTRNKAIRLAKGAYIALADADDTSKPKRLERQVNYINKHRVVDVLGTSFCLFYDGSDSNKCKSVPAHEDDIRNGKPPVHNPTCLIKRSTFSEYGYYNPQYDDAEDVELWFRWFAQGVRFGNLPEDLYLKRIHVDSTSISKIKHQTYLLLKINLIAVSKNRIRFTTKGYLRIAEQALYFLYLLLRLDRIYARDKAINTIRRNATYGQ